MMIAPFVLLAAAVPLQWNVHTRTDVPYECEIQTARIEKALDLPPGCGFAVHADGKELKTVSFPGRAPGSTVFRFSVPPGTTRLTCVSREAPRVDVDSATLDNLFAAALKPSASWRNEGVEQTPIAGGFRFAAQSAGNKATSYAVDLGRTADAAPLPVKLELDVKSVSSMTWGAQMSVRQLDAAGEELPEYATDARWTTEMLPPGRAVSFREKGLVHPRARTLVFRIAMAARDRTVDAFGLPRTPGKDAYPQLEVTRLVLRPAAELPFPAYDTASFFGAGVSKAAGDKSLKLARTQAFWYQTRGLGSWARGIQYRDERNIFFPAGAGTVEAWFKPDWTDAGDCDFYLFEGSSHALAVKPNAVEFPGRKVLFSVRYQPGTKTLSFYRRDMKDKVFAGKAKAEIPSGRWTHVACTFTPGACARVWVNGAQALEVPLAGFAALDLETDPLPNNTDVVECYLGSGHVGARVREKIYSSEPLMTGEVDLWRVSSGVRYTGAFTPATAFVSDAATRALFTFDDTFDGVSAGGAGVVLGTMRAATGRRLNAFEAEGREVRYFPAELQSENDPAVVLDPLNYPVLPTEEEFKAARRSQKRTFTLKNGETARLTVPAKAYPDYVQIANRGDAPLVYPIVLNADDVDARSFGDFAESLEALKLTDRERANRTFGFLLKASDYFIADSATYEPDSNVPECVMRKPLTMINGYCGFECGPLNTMASQLFACAAGCPASMTGGYGHSFQQVFFDGKNHVYDLSAQKFFPSFDNETSVGLEEAGAEPGTLNRVGNSASHFIRLGTRTASLTEPDFQAKTGITLQPGETFRVWFDNCGAVNDLACSPRLDAMIRGKTRNFFMPYGTYERETAAATKQAKIRRMERFFPQYGNGFLEFRGRPALSPATFVDEGASFRYRVASGYPIVAGDYAATRADGTAVETELSFDGGKTWQSFGSGKLTYPVRARLAYWVRVKAALRDVADFRAVTTVQVNGRVYPGRVRTGENAFRFKTVSGPAAEVTVAWRENAQLVEIAGAVPTGTIPGAEKLTAAFDPTRGPLWLDVTGLSAAAEVFASEGLTARLDGGRLVVAAADAATPRIGFVTLRDRGAEKVLTVIACPQSRFVVRHADFAKPGARADFAFDPLPAGDYMILSVNRFASHPKDLLGTYLSLEVEASPRVVKKAASAVNPLINYYKAHYGRKGERANWKWDFTLDPDTFRPYWGPLRVKAAKGLDRVTFAAPAVRPPEGGAEIAAVLVIPFPEDEFRCELEKILCGINTCPERVK